MKIVINSQVELLEEIRGGSPCRCIIGENPELYYGKPANNITECEEACCGPVSLYVHIYTWWGEWHRCWENLKRVLKNFLALFLDYVVLKKVTKLAA